MQCGDWGYIRSLNFMLYECIQGSRVGARPVSETHKECRRRSKAQLMRIPGQKAQRQRHSSGTVESVFMALKPQCHLQQRLFLRLCLIVMGPVCLLPGMFLTPINDGHTAPHIEQRALYQAGSLSATQLPLCHKALVFTRALNITRQ